MEVIHIPSPGYDTDVKRVEGYEMGKNKAMEIN